MATLDLDEGGWTAATEQNWQAPKHSWRQSKETSMADWTIVLDLAEGGTKSYHVHKILLGTGERSSAMFSRIFNRTITTAENQNSFPPRPARRDAEQEIELTIKTSDGHTEQIRAGGTMTVDWLRNKLAQTLLCAEERLTLTLNKPGSSGVPLTRGWRSLRSFGIANKSEIHVAVRAVWMKSDAEKSTTTLALPRECESAFETVLDYLYEHLLEGKVEIPANNVLGVMELARRLEMRTLGLQAMQAVQKTLQEEPEGAVDILKQATALRLNKIYMAALQTATDAIEDVPPENANLTALPLDVFEELLTAVVWDTESLVWRLASMAAAYMRRLEVEGMHQEEYELLSGIVQGQHGEATPGGMSAKEREDRVRDVMYLLRVSMERRDEPLKQVCLDKVACAIAVMRHDDLNRLEVGTVMELLQRTVLDVQNEDEVYWMVLQYVQDREVDLSLEQRQALWTCVRFAHLSVEVQVDLLATPDTPSRWFLESLVAEKLSKEGGDDLQAFMSRFKTTDHFAPRTVPRVKRTMSTFEQNSFLDFRFQEMRKSDGQISNDGRSIDFFLSGSWRSCLLAPVVNSLVRSYVEFVIHDCNIDCDIMLGLTSAGKLCHGHHDRPDGWMFSCHNTAAFFLGGRARRRNSVVDIPAEEEEAPRKVLQKGDRVGIMVEKAVITIFLNKSKLGLVHANLPPQVHLVVEAFQNAKLSIDIDATLPEI